MSTLTTPEHRQFLWDLTFLCWDEPNTQPELPLPAQEALTAAQTEELLKALLSAVTALGGRVDGLSGKHDASVATITKNQNAATEDLAEQVGTYSTDMRKVLSALEGLQKYIDGGDYRQVMRDDVRTHVGNLKEEVGFLSSALDSHIEKFGAINQEARQVIEEARTTQREARYSLEGAKDFVRNKTRIAVFVLFIVVNFSGWAGYQAAMKFETDTGSWSRQLKKAWSPILLCNQMGFEVQPGNDGTNFCVIRFSTKR